MSPGDEPVGTDGGGDGDVGRVSLWFLRAVAALTVLVVVWFLIDAVPG